jgi:hypothetical protein
LRTLQNLQGISGQTASKAEQDTRSGSREVARRRSMSLRKGPMPRSAKVLFWLIGFPVVLTLYGLWWLFLFIDTFGVEPRRERPRGAGSDPTAISVPTHQTRPRANY